MLRFTKVFALLLLILWMPVSLHCAMDRAGWFEAALSCCDENAGPSNSEPSSECCANLESRIHQLTTTEIKAPALTVPTAAPWATDSAGELDLAPLVVALTAACPPELARTWQFQSRAALPLRAPPAVC